MINRVEEAIVLHQYIKTTFEIFEVFIVILTSL